MNFDVSIVICWEPGTDAMLSACLASIVRHTKDVNYEIVLACKDIEGPMAPVPVLSIPLPPNTRYRYVPVQSIIGRLRFHGAILDGVIPEYVGAGYVLTLDSDCSPIADGWLSGLIAMLKDDVHVAGILHPWSPPDPEMNRKSLEWRIRSQHNWEHTHVACQLMRRADIELLRKEGHSYVLGDDTGLDITLAAAARRWKTAGYKPTRCPIPFGTNLDPEFNRYASVVYGDKVYHHGMATRMAVMGDKQVFGKSFHWCEKLVLWGKGAEFLLEPEFSYCYKFDREEEVAKEKMARVMGLDGQRMPG